MASATAHALTSGSLSSSLTRPHATSDSRLLTNLVKCEKALASHLDEEVKAAHTASAALAAWGTSEAPDIASTANRLSNLLNAVADVQRTHVQAIEGYRSALKDVLDREQSIRTVVRDRDILVGRLIKASKKTKGTEAEKAEKVTRAQRELHSCEQVLQAEESALIGVKRRTFKEALTMRMKTMGDAGAGMVDAARDAIILLDGFDTVGGGADMGNRGIMGDSDGMGMGMGHGMDESGEWDGEEDGRNQLNDPRMSAQFESASVTPSQSASQVQYGNRLNQGPSQRYSTNLHDIGDASGPDAPEKNGNGQEESDTESEDDYQRAFSGENLNRHSNVPPPHLLSAGAGTDNDFLPSAPRDLAPPNGRAESRRSKHSPAPTPPRKDSSNDLRKERAAAVAAHPPVPMPSIPTAPRLNMDGTNLGSIPRAPSMYVAGADAQSSSDEDTRPTTQNRGGWGSSSRTTPSRPPLTAGRGGDNSSDEGGTVTSKRRAKRSNSFFGKVGKLFKTDLQKQPASGRETPRNTPERARSNWETRTDANLSSVKGHDSISRRTSVLRGPINPPEPDSSDEEEPRDVVKHVNPRRPLWQGEKASSDVGVGGGIGSLSKRPSMLKRSSSNATARITPGPMSSKAAEEAARKSVIGAGFVGTPSKPATGASGTGSIKKKKKKKAPSIAGSEVGTSATRTRATGPPPAASSGANERTSVVVPGDASSGIRRSGSVSTGTGKGAASLSRAGTTQSIRSVDGGKKKRSSLANMAPNDGDGKFTTSSWIAKSSESNPSVQNMTAAQAAANAGVVPKGSPAAVPTSNTITSPTSPIKAKASASASASGSASKAAPLKPALKGGLSRSGSYSSSAGPSPAAMLGAPIQAPPSASSIFSASAPPPVTSSNGLPSSPSPPLQGPPKLPELKGLDDQKERPKAPESALSIQEDKTFDGTGHLDVSLDRSEGAPQKAALTPVKKQSVPKLDMPTPEPFSFDLEARRDSSATAGTVSPGLMTPSQREAYERILGEGNDEVSASPSRHLKAQPEGVTRITDRSQKLSTSRVYSSGGGLVDDSSSESEQGLQAKEEASPDAARKAAEAQMSGAFSDEKSDPQLKGLSASIGSAGQPSGGLAPAIRSGGPRSDTSSSAVGGNGVDRRKSVRMAPDTKLPPETPTGDAFDTTPRGDRSESRDPMDAAGKATQSQSQLSSRIAPPPQAPPRLPNKEAQNQPIDLGRDRERSSWTTRIGQSNDDSSSDEDGNGDGLDAYASARRAFGSASRHLGKATGEIKPKKKKDEEATGSGSGSVKASKTTKSKKKKEPANHGYNASVPLPAGMEVVGRSPSVKKKK